MIRRNKIDIDYIKKVIEDLGVFFSRFGDKVVVVYFFGLFVVGIYIFFFDIDIVVLFDRGFFKKVVEEFENEIFDGFMKIFKIDEIDFVVLGSVFLFVRYGVLKIVKIIYCNNVEKMVDF